MSTWTFWKGVCTKKSLGRSICTLYHCRTLTYCCNNVVVVAVPRLSLSKMHLVRTSVSASTERSLHPTTRPGVRSEQVSLKTGSVLYVSDVTWIHRRYACVACDGTMCGCARCIVRCSMYLDLGVHGAI
ncbi:hypothetical protein C8Q80DRAFT_184648 [Daedaleopsis nitida]|nr:hypothetical protein C8Q80DRAFT_184648 [Daedaleopsis nitida]